MSQDPPPHPTVSAELVVAKVSQTELGRALVERAGWEILAEHYAAEAARLREEAAPTAADEPAQP